MFGGSHVLHRGAEPGSHGAQAEPWSPCVLLCGGGLDSGSDFPNLTVLIAPNVLPELLASTWALW